MAFLKPDWLNQNDPDGPNMPNAYVTIVGREDYRDYKVRLDLGAFRSKAHAESWRKTGKPDPFAAKGILVESLADYVGLTGHAPTPQPGEPAVSPTILLNKDGKPARPGREFANHWLAKRPEFADAEEV